MTVKGYAKFLLIMAGLGGLLYGVDVGVIAAALPYIERTSTFTQTQIGWIVGMALWGSLPSSLVAGLLAEWFGRKKMIIASALLFLISIPVICASGFFEGGNFWMMVGGRGLQGAAAGLFGVIVPMYLAECLDADSRGKGTGMFQLLLTIGLVFVAVVGFVVSKGFGDIKAAVDAEAMKHGVEAAAVTFVQVKDWFASAQIASWVHAWQLIFLISCIPGFILFVGAFKLKESSRWLYRKGRCEDALGSLASNNGNEKAREILTELVLADAELTKMPVMRATRKQFLIVQVSAWVVVITAGVVFFILSFCSILGALVAFFVMAVVFVIVEVLLISVTVRRLHDLNMSGWWCVLIYILNSTPLGLVAYLFLMCKDGTRGVNRYGIDPKCRKTDLLESLLVDGRIPSSPYDKLFAKKSRILDSLHKMGILSNDECAQKRKVLKDSASQDVFAANIVELSRNSDSLLQKKYVIPFILAVVILACNQTTGINSVLNYTVTIFQKTGMQGAFANMSDAVIKIVNCVMTVVACALVDRKGRKFLLKLGTSGIILGLCGVGTIFLAISKGWVAASMTTGVLATIFFVMFVAFYAVGPGVCVWLALTELMPTRIRATGMSIAMIINQGVSAGIATVFPWWCSATNDNGSVFFVLAGFTVIYFITAAFFLPETKGRTLEEVEKYFTTGKMPEKN